LKKAMGLFGWFWSMIANTSAKNIKRVILRNRASLVDDRVD